MKKLIIIITVIVLVVAGFVFFKQDEEGVVPIIGDDEKDEEIIVANQGLEILADAVDEYGVKVDSTFTLRFTNAVELSDLETALVIEPELKYDIEQLEKTVYQLTPKEELLKNTIYQFVYKDLDYGKAFQITDDLKIFESYPGHDAYSVVTQTGIELYFNSSTVTAIEDHFSIEPLVAGKFTYQGNQVTFIPEQLSAGVTYKVTISNGLSDGERILQEDYSFSFTTGFTSDYNWNTSFSIMNVIPESNPVIKLNTWDREEQYHLKIYQAEQFENYHDIYNSFITYNDDLGMLESLSVVYEDNLEPFEVQYDYFLSLPTLESGRYIAVVEELSQYVFVQVDPHQIYYADAVNGDMFWIINNETNSLVSNAEIYQDGDLIGTTGEDGIALLDNPEQTDYTLLIEGKSYLVKTTGNMVYYDSFYYGETRKHWVFMYTDRTNYMPNDTVNIFGFVRSYTDQPISRLNLKLSEYWNGDSIIEKSIVLDDNYTFTESLDISDLKDGYYNMQLFDGETQVSNTEISVSVYEKPEVQLESAIDEMIVYSGDNVNYHLKAQYFNGIPYEDFRATINHFDDFSYQDSSTNYRTDEKGEINLKINTEVMTENWRPVNYSVVATNEYLENTYLQTRARVSVLPRDIMILTENSFEESLATVDFELYTTDITDFNGNFGVKYENIKGQAIDKDYRITVKDIYYDKVFVETVYDPIHKVSYDKYDYVRRESFLPEITGATLNGKSSFKLEMIENHSYEYTIITTDQQNRKTITTGYLGDYYRYWIDYSNKYSMPYEDISYDIGDLVVKEVLAYGETIASTEGDFALHLFLQDGILKYEITDEPTISFEFEEAFRPNIFLKTIYFDGDTMNIVPTYGSYMIQYDYETLQVELDVVTDKNEIKPGESIDLYVETDPNFNGVVNISVVDEAYFELYPDNFKIGNRLHQYIHSDGILVDTVSDENETMMDGAEMGDGMYEDFVRDDFRDTAAFTTIPIVNGKGSSSITLPDNLTSWRLTVHAVDKYLHYGSEKINVNVVLSYFVRGLYNKEYLTGDVVNLAVRSDGQAIDEGETILYEASLLKDNLVFTKTEAQVNTKDVANLSIGALEEGNYDVVVVGDTGDYQDGIKEAIEVADTFMYFKHNRFSDLTDAYQLMTKDETTLSIYNKSARDFQNDIFSSYSYDTVRLEEIVARLGGMQLLNRYFGYEIDDYPVNEFVNFDGGLKPLITGDSSIETTALIYGTKYGLTYFNKGELRNYLQEKLSDESVSREIKAMIIWAFSANDEPMLLAVDGFIQEKMTSKEKLYIGMALTEMGDTTRAKTYLKTLSLDSSEQLLLAVAENKLGLKVEDIDLTKIESNNIIHMHKIYYLTELERSFEYAEVSYLINGELTTIELPDAYSQTIRVPKSATFEITNVDGEVYARENYYVNGTMYQLYTSSKLALEREFESTLIKQGDMVKVTYKYEKPSREFVKIIDRVPAGFEFAGDDHTRALRNSYVYNDNQNIIISVYDENLSGEVSYYIRAVQTGQYHTEPAAIQLYYKGELEMTAPTVLDVYDE